MAAVPESRFVAFFRSAGSWAKDHRSETFAALTFVVSVSLALFFGLSNLGEPDPKLTFEIMREIDVLDVRTPVEDLQITFQNEDIQVENLNLRIYAMRVVNNGEVDILQTQFDQEQSWGRQVIDGRVIEARLNEARPNYLLCSALYRAVRQLALSSEPRCEPRRHHNHRAEREWSPGQRWRGHVAGPELHHHCEPGQRRAVIHQGPGSDRR